jgi:NitT/TauT family transport system permease protein
VTRAHRRRVLATRTTVIAAALAFVELAPRAGLVDGLTLVPLSEMIATLAASLTDGEIYPHLLSTGAMIIGSFLLAAVSGVAAGYALWRNDGLRRALNPYLASYYALPVFAFYPVLVAIFGLNRTPVVLLAWAYASIAVVTNTALGFDSVREVHLKVARVYRLTPWQTLRQVQLPAAAPHVFTGLKLAVTYAVIGVIASEFILATQGLGWLVAFHYNSFELAEMYASIVLVMAVAVAVTSLVTLLERRLWPVGKGA